MGGHVLAHSEIRSKHLLQFWGLWSGWVSLGPWQKSKSQHSWEKQVLLFHTIQMGKTEVSLARTGHIYWVRNSFPAKNQHVPWGKDNSFILYSNHSILPGPGKTLPRAAVSTNRIAQKPTNDRKAKRKEEAKQPLTILNLLQVFSARTWQWCQSAMRKVQVLH